MPIFSSYFCARFADQTDITKFRQILIKTKLYLGAKPASITRFCTFVTQFTHVLIVRILDET